MITWHLETRKIVDLKDYYKNPRKLSKHDADNLKKSLQEFGTIDKPIINQDGTLIGGHQRKRILKSLGQKEIECWVPDVLLDEKQVEELNVRLNRNHGEFDYDILANNFDIIELLDWGFKDIDFDAKDILKNMECDDIVKEFEKENKHACPNCGYELKKGK